MMKRWLMAICLVGAVAVMPWQGQIVQAQAEGEPEAVLTGLNGPQGVLVAPDGTVWAIDSGMGGEDVIEGVDTVTGAVGEAPFGISARVVRTTEDGGQEDVASLPSVVFGEELVGGSRLALLDGELYATNGFWTGHESYLPPSVPGMGSIMRIEDGDATEVVNITDLERDENPDGTIYETHPYGIAAGPDGNLWVADAGGNMLLRVAPDGSSVEVVTVFDGVPGVFPSPTRGGEMIADPVPTGITFDADGNAYVSYLTGAPFVPGAAKVVAINEDGSYEDYATGLTMLTDLRTAPNGDMFAVQFAIFGEQGPQMSSGAIVRVLPGAESEVVLGGLPFPTSIDFNEDGDAYISIFGVGPPGSGSVIHIPGLMDAEAVAMAEGEMAEEDMAEPAATAEPEEEMAEDEMAEPAATAEPEEEMAEDEMAEPAATAEPEEEMAEDAMAEDEMAEPAATAEPEEEMAEDAMAEPAATAEPDEEMAEDEMAEPAATAEPEEEMAEDEMMDDDAAPADLPSTGGSGPSLPLAVGVVLLVVAGLGLSAWRGRQQPV